jgi:hypothetical protein
MSSPSGMNPAGAGLTLVATAVLCGGVGLGGGALIGSPVPVGLAGFFAGLVAGFALVYSRYRDI